MTQTLTQLIAAVQALFVDDGTQFDTPTCTAAIRQALHDFNVAVQVRAGETQPVVSGQYDYELSDSNTLQVLDVLLEGTDSAGEDHQTLPFNPYFEDGRAWIRLQSPLSSGTLIIRYTIPYTINGLDGSVESTLPSNFDPILTDGACYRAAYARAASRIEEINLNAGVAAAWFKIADIYKQVFDLGIAQAQRQPAAALPDKPMAPRSWNDEWQGWPI